MRKRKLILAIVGVAIIVITLAVSSAFYSIDISNDKKIAANLTSGTMSLIFEDNDDGIDESLGFNEQVVKKFKIVNSGSLPASLSIDWHDLVNTYHHRSLTYKLYYSDKENSGFEIWEEEANIPVSSTPITQSLSKEVSVPGNTTYYYNLVVKLVDLQDVEQSQDLSANFSTRFTVNQPYNYRYYKVYVQGNGGTWSDESSQKEYTLKYGEHTDIDSNITRAGYTLAGFDILGEGSSLSGNTVTMGISDTYLKAKWSPNDYNLSIDPNGGSYNGSTEVQNITIKFNTPTEIGIPVREGYTFIGWEKVGGDFENNKFTLTEPGGGTLTAKWEINNYKYIVYHYTMDLDGINYSLADTEVFDDAVLGQKVTPAFKFIPGFTSEGTVQEIEIVIEDVYPPELNKVEYRYSRNKYALTVDTNGGTGGTESGQYYYGQKITLEAPSKPGYSFKKWTKVNGVDSILNGSELTMGSNPTTVQAVWDVGVYSINFNANGGNVETNSKLVTYGSTYGDLPVPTYKYYDFLGWYTEIDGGELVDKDSTVSITENSTLYAHWRNQFEDEVQATLAVLTNNGTVVNTTAPDFGGAADTNEGLYSMKDDYGTSYYFRGAVTDNYVKFGRMADYYLGSKDGYSYLFLSLDDCESQVGMTCAEYNVGKDMYWRILRINGDGSLRLIYDGTSAWDNGTSNFYRNLAYPFYNSLSNDNKYGGWMYGGSLGEASTSKAQAQANETDSNMKEGLDKWYKNNLLLYNDYISDEIFCNDRSTLNPSYASGFGENSTYYGFERFKNNTSAVPQLTCTQENDMFTVSTDAGGNGDLTYPIGIISADEVIAAGGHVGTSVKNTSFYLYKGRYFATMTPSNYYNGSSGSYLTQYFVDSNGLITRSLSTSSGVSPVINIKPSVAQNMTGSGTTSDPYVIATNVYKVVLNANIEHVDTYDDIKFVKMGNKYGDLPTPTKQYYEFLGWYTEKVGGTKVSASTVVTTAGDHTLYAHWKSDFEEEVAASLKVLTDNGNVVNTGTPDFMTVATTDEGLYATEDNYGTSYYFRGNTSNNYVKLGTIRSLYYGLNSTGEYYKVFATLEACQADATYNYNCQLYLTNSDMWWRIIRINGDGSLRIQYDGTQAWANGTANINRVLYSDYLNSMNDDNKYLGYMYGGSLGEASTSKAQAQANETDSNMKYHLEQWFDANLGDYDEILADSIFCNDRSTQYSTYSSGFAKNSTYYGFYRLGLYTYYNYPTLYCSQEGDRFTKTEEGGGNGKLSQKVGLITADEINMAGALTYGRTDASTAVTYLNKGRLYYTMSPGNYYYNAGEDGTETTYGLTFIMNTNGVMGRYEVNTAAGVAPVINIKAEYVASMKGSGTSTDPYTLDTSFRKVSFNANGGTVGTVTKLVKEGNTYGDLPTPVLKYHTFLGWFTDKTEGTQVTSDTVMTSTENHTLYAHWKSDFEEEVNNTLAVLTSNGVQVQSGEPDFTVAATTDEGLYSMKDNYGDSYYFRGSVTNNYVKFGTMSSYYRGVKVEGTTYTFTYFSTFEECRKDGYLCSNLHENEDLYWRIIRINGDGSLRLIYDGTQAYENGTSSTNRSLFSVSYNKYKNDNKYIGYMFGGDAGVASTSKARAQANETNSAIKQSLENWYGANLIYYDKYISDEIFCNDRSTSNPGYGEYYTLYGSNIRMNTSNPIFKCNQDNDKFTVDSNLEGNGKLKYKVGLITSDEAMAAGLVNSKLETSVTSNYLYKGHAYWTMSPSNYYYRAGSDTEDAESYAVQYIVANSTYSGSFYRDYPSVYYYMTPVINLKADYAKTLIGSGTSTDPFVIPNSSYIVEFDANNSTSNTSKIVDYGSTYGELPTPTRDNYIFLGWFNENSEQVTADTVVTKNFNHTLTARWKSIYEEKVNETLSVLTSNGTIINTGSMDVSQIADTNEGLYKVEDDLGESYIFRGNVTDNYVKFAIMDGLYLGFDSAGVARGVAGSLTECNSLYATCEKYDQGLEMWWRIVRVNGDGSLRIMYDGFQGNENSSTSTNRILYYKQFNDYSDDNKYVGYMYGGLSGQASTSRSQAQANETSSVIKTSIENWYSSNLLIYDDYISDSIFCNDRLTTSGGYGTTSTTYAFGTRQSAGKPSLVCNQDGDKFTVNTSSGGNGKLSQKIGLITADEVVMAGSGMFDSSMSNSNSYMSRGNKYWTMTPSNYYSSSSDETNNYALNYFITNQDFTYRTAVARGKPDSEMAIVPVINIKQDYAKTMNGSGTIDDPYTISTNVYKVTFNANGGTVDIKTKTVKNGNPYGELPTPTQEYYIFQGWFTEKNGGTLVSSLTNVNLSSNQTLYAHWRNIYEEQTNATLNVLRNNGTPIYTDVDPDFSVDVTSDNGVYAMKDDYGTSYYFRGNVSNNYVKFGTISKIYIGYLIENSSYYRTFGSLAACQADSTVTNCQVDSSKTGKDMWWRIIRINGDGSLRLQYDGTQGYANGSENYDRVLFFTNYNNQTNDNKYIGYMYGGTLGEASTSKTQAQTNDTDSNVKSVLESWYSENLEEYDEYLADETFCNDRTIYLSFGGSQGFANNTTMYTLVRFPDGSQLPTFKCTNNSDRFTATTVRDGNGKLNKKIGLITVDELAAGGAKYNASSENKNTYLYKGFSYFTMSPSIYTAGESDTDGQTLMFEMTSSGASVPGAISLVNVNELDGVAPVINISSDYASSMSGSGTIDDPYVLAQGTYRLTFDANGGELTDVTGKLIKYGSTYGDLPTPVQKYYTFLGWYTEEVGGTKITPDTVVSVNDNQTLYAHWKNQFETEVQATLTAITQNGTQVNTTNPNFMSPSTTNDGLYSMKDDYGTSYYFRGNVDNNYVKFGSISNLYRGYNVDDNSLYHTFITLEDCESNSQFDGCEPYTDMVGKDMYWRIVRINGNGSLRLIYDGDMAYSNGTDAYKRVLGFGYWNSSYFNDNKYVGYMYGGLPGQVSTSKKEAQTNDTNSTIKNSLETWYSNNLLSYDEYIDDSIFCNNRQVWLGSGYGISSTYYNLYRYVESNHVPSFKCAQDNDAFTKTSEGGGNGMLSQKIGLLTADEAKAAGGPDITFSTNTNTSYYLYKGYRYYTMTPASLEDNKAIMYYVNGSGTSYSGGLKAYYAEDIAGIVPVINLSADYAAQLVGTGTASDPYVIPNGTYRLTFDADGGDLGDAEDSKLIKYNTKYGTLPTPTLRYHVFQGWYTQKVGGTQVTANTIFTGNSNVTLYAHWQSDYESQVQEVLNVLVNSGTVVNIDEPNFNEPSTTNDGLYSMRDDYGTSYYFRGNVNNNYVRFGTSGTVYRAYRTVDSVEDAETITTTITYHTYASQADCNAAVASGEFTTCEVYDELSNKPMYFRIVRINGDGSLRLIYDGVQAWANGSVDYDRNAFYDVWNKNSNDAKYAGFMFGGADGSPSTSVLGAQTNTTDSSIKKSLDSWYTANIAKYSSYLADATFCNDRTIYSGLLSGFGTNETLYAFGRLNRGRNNPSFICKNDNDRFTVSTSSGGNGALTNKIGLITADEVIAAGGVTGTTSKSNSNYYLYKGYAVLTMTPSFYSDTLAIYAVEQNDDTTPGSLISLSADGGGGISPVINISQTYAKQMTGNGTASNPYVIPGVS